MMDLTPKEKAQQLVDEMKHEIEFNCQPSIVVAVAKKCALDAVELFKKEMESYLNAANNDDEYWNFQARIQFYEQVKQEIEKL